MNTDADQTHKKENQLVSNESSQKKKIQPSFQVEDQRPEAMEQCKLQKMANNSPQAKKAAQWQATADHHTTQQYPIQKKENNTGLPNKLKAGIEN